MKQLVLFCHPNPNSFCHGILEVAVKTMRAKGHEVKVKDLYTENFDPVLKAADFEAFMAGAIPLDIKAEQDRILWADAITVIYPVWWTGLPAMLKGYFDRVLTLDFAYSFGPEGPKGLLGGRKVIILSTQGAFKDAYDVSGMTEAMRHTVDTGIFSFCGMEVLEHRFFGNVRLSDEVTRKRYLSEVEEVMGRL